MTCECIAAAAIIGRQPHDWFPIRPTWHSDSIPNLGILIGSPCPLLRPRAVPGDGFLLERACYCGASGVSKRRARIKRLAWPTHVPTLLCTLTLLLYSVLTRHIPSQVATMDFLSRLAGWLDRPGFPWKSLIISFSLGEYLLENWLAFRQYRVLQGTKVPKQLQNEVDQATFDKSQVCYMPCLSVFKPI